MKRKITPLYPSTLDSEFPWLTLQEAADYLRLNKKTLGNYVSKGLVPVHISVMGGKRFKREELDAWISTTRRGFLPTF